MSAQPSVISPAIDRGAVVDLVRPVDDAASRWLVVARMGSLRTSGRGFSVWLQLRGHTRVQAREGEFALGPGEWIALDRDSSPQLQADRHGITLGVIFPADPTGAGRVELLPGRGRMQPGDLRIALRLWRNGRGAGRGRQTDLPVRALQSMLAHFTALQQELDLTIHRCPGRSLRRKRQVFGRMQRARLYLEGHRHRVVRLTELAELTSFSSWYLSKTFHEVYDESPQAASVRLRLEHACELLAATDSSISEVGAACGFDNSCSFARAFRARFRSTASAYRAQQRARGTDDAPAHPRPRPH